MQSTQIMISSPLPFKAENLLKIYSKIYSASGVKNWIGHIYMVKVDIFDNCRHLIDVIDKQDLNA